VVAVAAIAVLVHDAVPSVPFDERDWVVLADFDNRTGDSLFDASLNEAFRVAIQQSARVNIFPAPRVVETLRRMRQDTAASLTGGLAREVAQREALRLAVVPAISRLGDTYVLTTRVVDPATGEDLVARSERADRPEAVLVALDHLAIQLRRDLGESRLAVRRAGRPLPEVTTSSLDALRAWSLGRQVQFTSSEAFVHLQRAVELDSAFAMAHADLGAAYYWDGDRERGDHHFETALRLAERLTHRERLRLRATVLEWRRRDAEAVAAYEGMLLEYPDDRSVLFRLGYMHLRRNEWEAASEVFARLVAADSTDPSSRVNLASALAALGRYAQAVPEYRVAFALDSTMLMVPNLNLEFGASYVALGHYDSAEVLYRRLAAGDAVQRPQALRALGMLASHRGRFGDAAEMLRAAAVLQQESGASVSEARTRLQLAGAYRGMGDEVAAGRTLDRALALARGGLDPVWLERVGKLLARAGRVGDARALLTQLRDGMDSLNAVDRLEARILGAEVALAEGRTDDAVAEYERLRVTGGIAPVYLAEGHGRALHRAGRLAEAARAYESMLADSRLGFGWEPQLYAPAALLDLGLVYEAQADTARAGATYRRLLTLWRGGDPEAPLRDSVTARLDWLALAGGR
jgi:tetratricopeptide (TPR) repeat protein